MVQRVPAIFLTGKSFFEKLPLFRNLQNLFSDGAAHLHLFSIIGFSSFLWKTNVFLFSFTNESLIFFKKMKEYYTFTLV